MKFIKSSTRKRLLKKLNRTNLKSSNSTYDYISKKNWKRGHEEIFALMLIAALLIIAKTWKQLKYILIDKMDKEI